ncbi:sugar phosphate isomerase/epimerase [bacterium]|nr:sugar phosphate isomerase/epimerase [candidate division CSSED10-310 bacterium]
MKCMVCAHGDEDEFELIPYVKTLNVGIELQSYGLKGVLSEQKWNETLQQHLKFKDRWRGRIAVHGPFLGIKYDYQDHILKEAVKMRLNRTYEVVRQIKPDTLVLHTGFSDEVEKFHLQNLWLQETMEFWQKEIEKYAALNVTVVLENIIESDPSYMKILVDNVNHPNLKLCFDIGHAHVWSHWSPSEWIEFLGNRIFHIHLHDNAGEQDNHLPVGKGSIDFENFFNTVRKHIPDVTISLEVDSDKETVIENLNYIIERYII